MIAHEDDIIVAETGIIDIRNKHYLVPHNVSAVFTGRNDVCKQLYENCVSSRPFKTQTRFVLYGLGGSGKTQVSLKFAQDNRERYLCGAL